MSHTCNSCGKETGETTYWAAGNPFCSQKCLNNMYHLSENSAVYESDPTMTGMS